jgi:hypothetical protein
MADAVFVNSPWPLFCGDLNLGQTWVEQRLAISDPRSPQIAHWGLSLGLHSTIEAWLDRRPKGLNTMQLQGLRFRIARSRQQPHAHRLLLKAAGPERRLPLRALKRGTAQIRIVLQGGLGDHLQDLSCLIGWIRRQERPVSLGFATQRASQFRRLLQSAGCADLIREHPTPGATDLHVLEVMALLGAPQLQPQAWLQEQASTLSKPRLTCCWTAVGTDDPFSAWCRSVPFAAVLSLYRQLLADGWTPASIVDLSRWRPWEAAQLRQLGLELVDPAAGDTLDLAQLVSRSGKVVSIDTALPHLCAAMGRSVWMLLPRFSDERWFELLQPGSSYSAHCQIIRQERFGCWQAELDQLSQLLSATNGQAFGSTATDDAATNG